MAEFVSESSLLFTKNNEKQCTDISQPIIKAVCLQVFCLTRDYGHKLSNRTQSNVTVGNWVGLEKLQSSASLTVTQPAPPTTNTTSFVLLLCLPLLFYLFRSVTHTDAKTSAGLRSM